MGVVLSVGFLTDGALLPRGVAPVETPLAVEPFPRVLGLFGALLCRGHAEGVTDRLHGFALDLPGGWKVVLADGGPPPLPGVPGV
ncbi:hypothetical protein [Thermus sediminis]|uniref:hypothetical protein n=1 Tax=Thermus sediminis TaxID=1761908 RepID=UPI001300664C|nr:hypothetical protein [Thermus sediminis]